MLYFWIKSLNKSQPNWLNRRNNDLNMHFSNPSQNPRAFSEAEEEKLSALLSYSQFPDQWMNNFGIPIESSESESDISELPELNFKSSGAKNKYK